MATLEQDPKEIPSQTEAEARRIRHHAVFDLSDGAIDEARTVDTAAKLLRFCRSFPAADKVEFLIKMPGELHIGGGYLGGIGTQEGQANSEVLGAFFRAQFANHHHHYGNNLGDKITAAADRQDQEYAQAAATYVEPTANDEQTA